MLPEPQISVVIPCYNDGLYLPETLASLKGCAVPLEVVIVDDGSTDNHTVSFIQSLRDVGGFAVIRQENSGQNAARNRGIREARAAFIVLLDADNRLSLKGLEHAFDLIQTHDRIAIVYGDAEIFGLKTERWINEPLDVPKMILGNTIDNCTLLRKSAWSDVGGHPGEKSFRSHEEWLFWLVLLKHGWKFAYLGETFFEYRMRPDSMLRTAGADMRKVTKVYAFAYALQKDLIDRLVSEGTLNPLEARQLTGRVEAKLAYSEIVYGRFFEGLRIWCLSILHAPTPIAAHVRILLLGPFKRVMLDLFNVDLRKPTIDAEMRSKSHPS